MSVNERLTNDKQATPELGDNIYNSDDNSDSLSYDDRQFDDETIYIKKKNYVCKGIFYGIISTLFFGIKYLITKFCDNINIYSYEIILFENIIPILVSVFVGNTFITFGEYYGYQNPMNNNKPNSRKYKAIDRLHNIYDYNAYNHSYNKSLKCCGKCIRIECLCALFVDDIKEMSRQAMTYIFLRGLFAGFGITCFIHGVEMIGYNDAISLWYLYPIIIVFVSPLVFREQHTWFGLILLILMVLSMIFVNQPSFIWDESFQMDSQYIFGIISVLFGCIVYSFIFVFNKLARKEQTYWLIISGSIFIIIESIWILFVPNHASIFYQISLKDYMLLTLIGFISYLYQYTFNKSTQMLRTIFSSKLTIIQVLLTFLINTFLFNTDYNNNSLKPINILQIIGSISMFISLLLLIYDEFRLLSNNRDNIYNEYNNYDYDEIFHDGYKSNNDPQTLKWDMNVELNVIKKNSFKVADNTTQNALLNTQIMPIDRDGV